MHRKEKKVDEITVSFCFGITFFLHVLALLLHLWAVELLVHLCVC